MLTFRQESKRVLSTRRVGVRHVTCNGSLNLGWISHPVHHSRDKAIVIHDGSRSFVLPSYISLWEAFTIYPCQNIVTIETDSGLQSIMVKNILMMHLKHGYAKPLNCGTIYQQYNVPITHTLHLFLVNVVNFVIRLKSK